ncbi:membrane protein insertase Oxa1/YidC/SpoIIIJ [Rhizobium ruizarguesonis]
MSIFGMAHVIGQIRAAPEIDEIEKRLHGKERIEEKQRAQQRGMAER